MERRAQAVITVLYANSATPATAVITLATARRTPTLIMNAPQQAVLVITARATAQETA